jgi:hypothetical protein
MKMKIKKISELHAIIAIVLGFVFMGSGSSGSICFAAGSAFSQDSFDKANRLYEEGKIGDALQLYRNIEKTGSNWKLFYNIGNCLYKLNRPVQAKIYYLKARKLNPFEDSIQNNIEIANKQLNDKIPYPQPDFVSRVLLRIESIVSLNVLSILLLVFVFIFNGFAYMWIKRGKTRLIVYGVSFSLLIMVLLGVYHIYRVDKFNHESIAVITKENSQLRSGPGENNTILFKVNPGLEVKIIEKSRNWIQVSASSDIAGWIEDENVEQI